MEATACGAVRVTASEVDGANMVGYSAGGSDCGVDIMFNQKNNVVFECSKSVTDQNLSTMDCIPISIVGIYFWCSTET